MLTLARLRVTSDALLKRDQAEGALRKINVPESVVPRAKHANDAVRVALAYELRKLPKFYVEDRQVEILAAEAKKVTGDETMRVCFHLRERGKGVDYSDQVCELVVRNGSHHVGLWKAEMLDTEIGKTLQKALDVDLVARGQDYLFDKDIRRMVEAGPFAGLSKIFPGTWLTTSEDQVGKLRDWNAHVLQSLHKGSASIAILELKDDEVNRNAIAQELADNFALEFRSIADRANDVGPILSKLKKDYQDVCRRMSIAADALDLPLEVSEDQEACELALMILEAETTN